MDARGWLKPKDSRFPNLDARRHAGRFYGFIPFCFLSLLLVAVVELNVTSTPDHPVVIPRTAGKAFSIIAIPQLNAVPGNPDANISECLLGPW